MFRSEFEGAFLSTTWRPEQALIHGPSRAWRKSTSDLTTGDLIIWERRPYRVTELRERDHTDWPAKYLDLWTEHRQYYPDPATWYHRPIALTIRPEPEPELAAEPTHLLAPADHQWWTLPEHYAICRKCGELPPCRDVHTETVITAETERMALEMAILPGACHACRQPITKRQKSIRFPGGNLIRPDLGDDSAIFHLREACRSAAERYDKRWAGAEPGRARKLYCEGRARHHYDGSFDCTDPACPGQVTHASAEWHRPDRPGLWSGCWCVSGDLTARLTGDGPR